MDLKPLSFIVPPNQEEIKFFITNCGSQVQNIKETAIKAFKDFGFDNLKVKRKSDKIVPIQICDIKTFISYSLMLFIAGKNTMLMEIVDGQDKPNNSDEITSIVDEMSKKWLDKDNGT